MPDIGDRLQAGLLLAQQSKIDSDLMKWQLNPDDILLEIEYDLKGYYYDAKEQQWKEPEDGKFKPQINNDGLRLLLSAVRSHINKVTFMTDFDIDDIMIMCRDLEMDIIKVLVVNLEEFEVDMFNLDLMIDKVLHLVYAGLKKSLDEGERRYHKETKKTLEIIGGEKKQEGPWPKILKR